MASKRILIVDDDENFRMFLREALKGKGFDVATAADGREAVEGLRAHRPDLILLDIMMPGVDGVSFCRLIRGAPATAGVPVLIISALGDPRTMAAALESGAADYIVKPVDFPVLMEKIGKALADGASRA